MPKFLVFLPFLFALGGCQVLKTANPDPIPDNKAELLKSEQITVAAGDEALRHSINTGSEADTTELDKSIAPGMRGEARKARNRLEQGVAGADNDETGEPDDLWDRLRTYFALEVDLDNPRVKAQLERYASHPIYFDRTVARASRYLYHIVEEIEARGLPGEFALLPMVESAYDPFAYSHGQAAGLWQFIPSTGRIYDLNQTWWKDGRRDILNSTDAALSYLDTLADQFDGNWILALASYNSGAGTVRNAIRRNEKKGLETDYWHLQLPRETRIYLPKLLAISELVRNPEKYGLDLPSVPDEPYFEVVDTQSQIDLAQAAKMAETELEEIYLLNPAFNRWATDPDGPHRLLVPVDKADEFRAALARTPPEERLSWDTYKVASGDSLSGIAHRFSTTVDVIQQTNQLDGTLIRIGQRLLIPVASANGNVYSLSAGERLEDTRSSYGDENKTKIEYQVKKGDTYWDISRQFDVNMRALAKWNGNAPGDPLYPGQKLIIWTEAGESGYAGVREDMVRKVGYRVRSGDSLYLIADRFNLQVQDIVSWNDINPKRYLQPGQQLTLYVDIRRSP